MFQLAARLACEKIGCDPAVVGAKSAALCLWLMVPIAVSLVVGAFVARGRDRLVIGAYSGFFVLFSVALVLGAFSLNRLADAAVVLSFCVGIVGARVIRRQGKLHGATGGRLLGGALLIGMILGLGAMFFVVSRMNSAGQWHW
jgi:hypothetical protein